MNQNMNANELINDMEHANGPEAMLVRAPLVTDPDGSTHGEYEKCSQAFFPGCQLGASEPEIVAKVYDALLFQCPDTAIFMQCCGAAAQMAGDDDAFQAVLEGIRAEWDALGKPEMIMACPACTKVFREHLPEIKYTSLYEKFVDYQIGGGCNSVDYSIFHPPAADIGTRKAAETLAEDMGVKLHREGDENYGDYPIITYGIKIRDAFKEQGKDSAHLLELMFGMGASNTHLIHEHDQGDGASENGTDAVSDDHDCDGDCATCALDGDCDRQQLMMEHECDGNCSACAGCGDGPASPAPLPDTNQRRANRKELKEVLSALYWNEM